MTLYHGTRAPFGKGGLILPGTTKGIGKDNHDLGRSDWVYVTSDLDLAKDFAKVSTGRGKAKVFEVLYVGEIEHDNSTVGGEEHESYRVTEARVVRRVWKEDD